MAGGIAFPLTYAANLYETPGPPQRWVLPPEQVYAFQEMIVGRGEYLLVSSQAGPPGYLLFVPQDDFGIYWERADIGKVIAPVGEAPDQNSHGRAEGLMNLTDGFLSIESRISKVFEWLDLAVAAIPPLGLVTGGFFMAKDFETFLVMNAALAAASYIVYPNIRSRFYRPSRETMQKGSLVKQCGDFLSARHLGRSVQDLLRIFKEPEIHLVLVSSGIFTNFRKRISSIPGLAVHSLEDLQE